MEPLVSKVNLGKLEKSIEPKNVCEIVLSQGVGWVLSYDFHLRHRIVSLIEIL
jgi:hypothetical protein